MKIDTAICKISIAGEASMEYGEDISENGKCKTAYIASEEGKPFSITVDLTSDPRNHDRKYTYHIYVDGEITNRYYAHVGTITQKPRVIDSSSLKTPESNGYFLKQPLQFKKVDTGKLFHTDP